MLITQLLPQTALPRRYGQLGNFVNVRNRTLFCWQLPYVNPAWPKLLTMNEEILIYSVSVYCLINVTILYPHITASLF